MHCNIYLDTHRSGYGIDQIDNTLTVEELMDILSEFDPNAKVYFRNDGGYTYGGISESDFEEDWEDVDDSLDIE